MAQEIIPDKQSVLTCLKQKVYYVDFYQREYVWTKNTVEVLLNDIFYAFEISYKEHKDEEMSQEVLEKYNWYYLNVFITNKVEGKVFIVDGQQRLSTLTLIATKLYHITKNDNLRDILRDCIFAKDQFKGNVFCIDNDKRKNVMQCILDGSEYQDAYKNKTEETIIERYADISKFIDDKQLVDVKLTAFIYYFLNRLVLVELSIQKDDTPMVFEVINDRGEALKPFEILKGKMIGLLSKSDTNKYSEKWDVALNRISGREDNFFADYLKSQFVFKKNTSLEKQIINSYHRYIFDYNDKDGNWYGIVFQDRGGVGRVDDVLSVAQTPKDSLKALTGTLTVLRAGVGNKNSAADTLNLAVQFESTDEGVKLGFYNHPVMMDYQPTHISYGFFESFPAGIKYGWNVLAGYVGDMKYVFSKEGAKSLGGFGALGSLFPSMWDWHAFWMMTAFLSIILAFMNILPIPALDGGHVFFLLYEIITGRKPGDKFMERAEFVGFGILILLLVVANLNDVLRLFGIL